MTPQEKQRIAEGLLGEIDWHRSGEGFCRCPGWEHHTTRNGNRDCRVSLDGVPTISCFHQSCGEYLGAYNLSLRTQIGSPSSLPQGKRATLKRKADPEWVRAVKLAEGIRGEFPLIFKPGSPWWKGPQLLGRRLELKESLTRFWSLFESSDILWIGWCQNSGLKGLGHFHVREYWQEQKILYPFTCTGTFYPTHGHSRSANNIKVQRYDVIEFDKLSSDPYQNQLCGIALFFYLAEINPLRLRLIVDTGHKSIHFWVDHDKELFDPFYIAFLQALGADTNGFKPSQPVRFPGVTRRETRRPQTVLGLL